jgi:hypothetical protein
MKIIKKFLSKEQCLELLSCKITYTLLNKNVNYDGPDKGVENNNNLYLGICKIKTLPRPEIYDYILETLKDYKILSMFVLKYEVNSFLAPHMDENPPSEMKGINRVYTVLLNDNFTGGELVYPNMNKSFGVESIGDAISIECNTYDPLYVHHVNKINSGTRYSLVIRTLE